MLLPLLLLIPGLLPPVADLKGGALQANPNPCCAGLFFCFQALLTSKLDAGLENKKPKPEKGLGFLVAGTGLEPVTFGL